MAADKARTDGQKYVRGRRDFGSAGIVEVLKIDDLHIMRDAYQREIKADAVDKIQGEYDMAVAGTIVVSKRANDDLYIIDGQHRSAAAKLAGENEILAQVIVGLTPQQEANMRLQLNTRKQDSVYESFRARVFAGDKIAKGMQEVAHRYETQINMTADTNHGINAIGTVEHIYKIDHGITLGRCFASLRTSFGPIEGQAANANMMKGVTWFLQRHTPDYDHKRLMEKMRIEGPAAIIRKARNHQVIVGGPLWLNIYRALLEIYNSGLGEKSKLEARTTRWSKGPSGVMDGGGGGGGWDR